MNTETLFEGDHIKLCRRGKWEYAERVKASGVVAVTVITDDDCLVLTEQFRPPVDARVIEGPAGLAGDIAGKEGEELAEAARRELLEEVGYAAEHLEPLVTGPSSAGLSSELLTIFLATGATKVAAGGGDASEDIETHEVPLDGVEDFLAAKTKAGVLVDPKVYAMIYFARRR